MAFSYDFSVVQQSLGKHWDVWAICLSSNCSHVSFWTENIVAAEGWGPGLAKNSDRTVTGTYDRYKTINKDFFHPQLGWIRTGVRVIPTGRSIGAHWTSNNRNSGGFISGSPDLSFWRICTGFERSRLLSVVFLFKSQVNKSQTLDKDNIRQECENLAWRSVKSDGKCHRTGPDIIFRLDGIILYLEVR